MLYMNRLQVWFKSIRKTATFIIIIIAVLLGLTWFGVFKLNEKYESIKNVGLDICTEWKSRNATLMVEMFDGYGVLDVSSNGEAYMECIMNNTPTVMAFTKAGYGVELCDGLPMTRSKHPVDMIEAAIRMASSIKELDASAVTGSELDKSKKAVAYKIEGVANVTEYFREVSSLADATLYTYGVKPESEVVLLIAGYNGISMIDESTGQFEIVNDHLEGFGTLQMDLIVDGKAYLIYCISTRATYDTPISLGAEIYTRGINDELSSEECKAIAEATIENVRSILEKR